MGTGPAGKKGRLLPVLAIVLATVSLFTLSYVLIFMNPNIDRLKDEPLCALSGLSFLNPYEGPVTRNGGGWDIKVGGVTGPTVALEDLVLAVKSPAIGSSPAHVWKLNVRGTGTNSSDLSVNSTKAGWYLRAGNATAPQRFANGTARQALNGTNAPLLRDDQFPTVEGAVLIYRDVDLDGKLSNGDRVLAYKDVNGDGTVELLTGTLLELQTTGGKLVASALLK